LEQLYGPKQQSSSSSSKPFNSKIIQDFAKDLSGLEADLVKHQRRAYSSAFDEVEQQREVEFEVHQLHEKQTPARFTALEFPGLDNALVQFCEKPEISLASLHLLQALDFISNTHLGRKYGIKGASLKLFVSKEFSKTVQTLNTDASRRIIVRSPAIRHRRKILTMYI
jgi:hypothetical protein